MMSILSILISSFWYRYTKEENLLRKAKDLIQQGFSHTTNFEPKSILICTWKDVHSHLNENHMVKLIIWRIQNFILCLFSFLSPS